MTNEPLRYKVYLTPLISKTEYAAAEIEISDYVEFSGIGSIVGQIDNGDFDIGVFTYSNVTIRTVNGNGKFNVPTDNRSLFPYSRDLAKIRVEFLDGDGNVFTTFKGVINDEATNQNYQKRSVSFKVLSYDSILKKILIPADLISNGDTFKEAMTKILNRVEVLTLLNFDVSDLNPSLNLALDVGSYFDDLTSRDGLNDLLLASNSILLIDDSDNIIVKARLENSNTPWEFYNEGDIGGRENVISVKKFNTGLQRTFNSVKVNNSVSNNDDYIETYNLKQKEITLDFITTTATQEAIADNILDEFKTPKIEMEIEVDVKNFEEVVLLDICRFNYTSLLRKPPGQDFISSYGQHDYGTVDYPDEIREFNIPPNIKYKVIKFNKKPKNRLVSFTIRQVGKNIGDGYFS